MVMPVGMGIFNSYLQGQEEQRRNRLAGMHNLSAAVGLGGQLQQQQQAAQMNPIALALAQEQLRRMQNPEPGYKAVGDTLLQIPSGGGMPQPVYTSQPKPQLMSVGVENQPGATQAGFGAPGGGFTPVGPPKIGSTAADRPYFQPVQTTQGMMRFNSRTGQMEPVIVGGQPVIPAATDPTLQGNIAAGKAAGKERGRAAAQAQGNLPDAIAKAEGTLSLIDQMIGSEDKKTPQHPGFQSYVGATLTPGARFIEGSDTAGFERMLAQAKGGAFLEAYQTLKGGGQITEIEGRKATEAITRMDKSQKEAEFIKAAREFQGVIRAGVKRAREKAGRPVFVEPGTEMPRGGSRSFEGFSIRELP